MQVKFKVPYAESREYLSPTDYSIGLSEPIKTGFKKEFNDLVYTIRVDFFEDIEKTGYGVLKNNAHEVLIIDTFVDKPVLTPGFYYLNGSKAKLEYDLDKNNAIKIIVSAKNISKAIEIYNSVRQGKINPKIKYE